MYIAAVSAPSYQRQAPTKKKKLGVFVQPHNLTQGVLGIDANTVFAKGTP